MIRQIGNNNSLIVLAPTASSAVAKGAADCYRDQRHDEEIIVLKRINAPSPVWAGEKGRFIDLYI